MHLLRGKTHMWGSYEHSKMDTAIQRSRVWAKGKLEECHRDHQSLPVGTHLINPENCVRHCQTILSPCKHAPNPRYRQDPFKASWIYLKELVWAYEPSAQSPNPLHQNRWASKLIIKLLNCEWTTQRSTSNSG